MTWLGGRGSKSRGHRTIAVLWLCGAAAFPALAQDNYAIAKNFIKRAYPATIHSALTATIIDQLSFDTPDGLQSFVLQLEKSNLDSSDKNATDQDGASPALTAAFVFASDRSIHSIVLSGSIVHEAENAKLRELVDAHPEWETEQIKDALKSSGVRYGPNKQEDFASAIPKSALQGMLGPFHVMSTEFSVRDEGQKQEHLPSAELHWLVKIEASGRNQSKVRYFLIFEPFDGRLIQLGKIGG